MSLDLFSGTQEAVLADAQHRLAPDLPATFGETFDISYRHMTEWSTAVAESNAREEALNAYYNDAQKRSPIPLPLYDLAGNLDLDSFNKAIGELAAKDPEGGWQPLSEADIATMTRRRMAAAHDDAAALGKRETTWGGTAGTIAGTLLGGLSDPVTLATLPFGFGEAGIALRAAEFAAMAGGTEAINAAASFQAREAAKPGSSREIPGEVISATVFGGALGAGFGALGKLLGAGRRPLLTEARDDVNVATSEAQLATANPFPTVAGEAAGRDGVIDAATSLAKGERVKAGESFDPAHVVDLAAVKSATTADDLALAVERDYRPLTHGDAPDVERFDPMPSAGEDAASYWDRRLAEASPEERAALGANDAGAAAPVVQPPTISVEGRQFVDTRGSGIRLHGSSKTEIVFDEGHYSSLNYYGNGFYTTDAADVAYGYSKRGAKTSGQRNLYEIIERHPVNLIDAEKPLTPELKSIITKADGRDEYVSMAIEDGAKNLREVFDNIRDVATGDGVSADEIQGLFSAIYENLIEAGYRGMSHIGGLRTNTKSHNVTIYFRPEEDLMAKKIGFGAMEAKAPTPAADAATRGTPTPDHPPQWGGEIVAAARDLSEADIAKLAADPATETAVLRNLDRVRVERPDATYTEAVRLEDGSYRLDAKPLETVMDDLDAMEAVAKDLEACATGMMAAE